MVNKIVQNEKIKLIDFLKNFNEKISTNRNIINKLKIYASISSDRNENAKSFLEFADEYRKICRFFGYDEKLYDELNYDRSNSDHEISAHFVDFGYSPLKKFKLVEFNNRIYFHDSNDSESKKEGDLIKLSSLKNEDSFWIYKYTKELKYSFNILKINKELTSNYCHTIDLMQYLEDECF